MSAWRIAAVVLDACCSLTPAFAFTAYVTNERDNTVSVVDLNAMKTVKTIPVGSVRAASC